MNKTVDNDIEAAKRRLLDELLEAAQRQIVSSDPEQALKGRFTRDCAVPIMHWLMDEFHRIHGTRFMTGGDLKSREEARAEVDVLIMLMDGMAAVSGNFVKTQISDGVEGLIAAGWLVRIFATAFDAQIRGTEP